MKKQIIRFFSLLMLVVLLVTAFAMQVNARVVFSDLAPTHWCYNKIIDFESKGYVCGYEDGTFKADQTITRAEYVKIVNNFFGYKPNTEKVANFSDVNSGDWFAPYVNEAVERGYITGFEDGTFRPQDPIRRQEATVILARILGIDKEVYPANHIDGLAQYSDSDEVQDWARVAIHSYSVYNFINGYTDGTLKILQNVTRAETVELLHVLEQKIIIDRKPGGSSKSTVKMPTIALYRFDKEANEFAAIKSSDLKSNWVNKAISTLSEDEYGVLVNVTSTTTGSTINEKLTGNKTGERKYITSKIEELTNAIFLTDGEYKISAFASKSGYHSSSSADKTILVDTKAPVVSGEVVTTLPVAHEQQVKVTIADPKANDVNRISGLDTSKVRYAWFKDNGEGVYEKATEWKNVILDTNGNKVITTEGLEYGTYKLAISAYDIAENPYGDKIDTVVTTSGDEEFREEIPYDFVEELEKEGEEKPEDPDITVIVGNNTPEVKDLVMRTEVNVEVSGKIVATDKDGDTLTYTLVESGDSACATVSGDTTSFKHGTVGTYYYNVEVSDGNGGTATALVTVYVYDINIVTPSGDNEDPIDYDVLANNLILYVGETKDVTASTTPKNEDATFEWNENSEEIEIVDDSQNNATVIVEGKVPGNTKMTVTVKVGEVEITRTINVVVKGRKLTIHYVYENGAQASEDYVKEEVGKDGYRVPSPAVEGYTPDFEVVSGDMLTEDTERTVTYKANTDTKYTVEYYTEDLTEGNYTRIVSEEKEGTTGEQVSIDTSRTFTGFTFDNDNENNVLQGEVAGNGSLVLKAYYTRNSYKLTLVAGKNVASVTGGGMHKYEEEVTIDAMLKNEAGYSYSFENWKSGDAEYSTSKNAKVTMPANDLTLTANATRIANTDTKYTVEYYTEDLTEGNYTRIVSEEKEGTTGEQVSIDTSRTFTGFTFDNDNENNVLQGEVAGNGSLVLKAYYTRNSYKLTLVAGDNIASVSGDNIAAGVRVEGTYKYGQDIDISAVLEEIDGYTVTFDKWKANGGNDVDGQNTTITMPASDLTLTAIAKKTEKDPNVTIDIVADYPNNNKQAEPGDTIKYVATIENEESHEIKVKIDVDSDAADTIDSIIVYDKDGNLVKRYDNLDEEIVIPAGGDVKISYSSVVPKDCPVNEDKFTSTVTVSTVAGSLIKKKTKSNSIEKSSDVLDATQKDKNVILILDLSGSMDENTKDGRTTKIAALRTAARQFVNKLYASSKETNTRVTLNVIGIGEAHDVYGPLGIIKYYTSPSKKNGKDDPILLDDRYNGCDAYLIGSYINTNQGAWISSNFIKNKLNPEGGTNIVGSLKLANGIMDETYGQANGINDYIKGADNYVVILTDGANGPSANKPISKDTDGLKYSTALRNSGAGIYAIYFEGNNSKANEIGKTDLNTILDGKYPLYEASSSDSLNMAFDSIASSINKVQSNKGIITAVLPDTGAYFPIIVTHTENGEEKELFKVTKKSELEDKKMKVTSDGKLLEWDLTGTEYSKLEGLKLKLTLGKDATKGEETESTIELLSIESGDVVSPILVVNIENEEENISGDSNVVKGDKVISSGDVKVEEEQKVEEKNEEKQEEPKVEEKSEGQQEEPKVEEKNEEQQEEPKVEEKNEEQKEEPKVEEKNEEQQEEPKAEEKNEEQQEESKVEENKDEEQEEPKVEEKDEQQKETKIKEEKKDEIIAVKPQVPSTEPQETSTDKDDEQE